MAETTTVLTVAYDGAPFAGFARQDGPPTVQGRLEEALAHRAAPRRRDGGRRPHRRGRARARPGRELRLGRRRRPAGRASSSARSTRSPAPRSSCARSAAARRAASARGSTRSRASTATGSCPAPCRRCSSRDVAWWVKGGARRRRRCASGARALLGRARLPLVLRRRDAREGQAATAIGRCASIDVLEIAEACELGEHARRRARGRAAFLHSMVRIVVGTLVEVGPGRRDPAWVAEALAARDRAAAGPTAPPHGLTLWDVDVPGRRLAVGPQPIGYERLGGASGAWTRPGAFVALTRPRHVLIV